MFKTKKLKVIIIIIPVICLIFYISFSIYEAEKMFYRYANDGDKWFCEKYNITLTCHVEENDTSTSDYYLSTYVNGIKNDIIISDARGGHAKIWTWYYKKYYDNENATLLPNENAKIYEENINLLYGNYYIKNKNTLEFTIYDDEVGFELDDDSLFSMFEPNEVLTFKRVAI